MNTLVLIPARGGSKGVANKNGKLLNGKPLLVYTIEAAREVFSDAEICFSTDSLDLKTLAEATGLRVPFLRPDILATDTATMYDVLLHTVRFYAANGFYAERLVLLQPTSPLRCSAHIREALAHWDDDCEMVVSVKETRSNPYYVLFEESVNGFLHPSKVGNFARRQDCPKVYEYNGAIYVIRVAALLQYPLAKFQKVKKYVMNETDSLDIDTPLDWQLAELILKNRTDESTF